MSGSDWVFGMEVLGLGLEYVRIRVIMFKLSKKALKKLDYVNAVR